MFLAPLILYSDLAHGLHSQWTFYRQILQHSVQVMVCDVMANTTTQHVSIFEYWHQQLAQQNKQSHSNDKRWKGQRYSGFVYDENCSSQAGDKAFVKEHNCNAEEFSADYIYSLQSLQIFKSRIHDMIRFSIVCFGPPVGYWPLHWICAVLFRLTGCWVYSKRIHCLHTSTQIWIKSFILWIE